MGFHQGALRIAVKRVYVPLHLDPGSAGELGKRALGRDAGGGSGRDAGARVMGREAGAGTEGGADEEQALADGALALAAGERAITLEEALARASARHNCLALIGDPGAGKTTLLRHLFRRVVDGDLAGIAHLQGLYPVMVRLADVEKDSELVSKGLAVIVRRIAAKDGYPDAAPALLAQPTRRYLFLLDGLDEFSDEATRKRLCGWLEDEIAHWPGCAFVLTSRRAAWIRTPQLENRFLTVSVQPLREEDIAIYVRQWFGAVEHDQDRGRTSPAQSAKRAEEKAAALLALFDSSAWKRINLVELRSNPLLLSALCLVHYRGVRLPDQRAALYEVLLKLLVEDWAGQRAGGRDLRLAAVRQVLQPLAHGMHEHDRRALSLGEAAALVGATLPLVPEAAKLAATPEKFLQLVQDECGVLTSLDVDRVELIHFSFQEYLAACHIGAHGLGAALAEHAGEPRWEEVILLAMSRDHVFAPFLARLLERGALQRGHPAEPLLRKCLASATYLDPAPLEAAADRALVRWRAPDGVLARLGWWLRGLVARLGRWRRGQPALRPAALELRDLFDVVRDHGLPGLARRARQVIDAIDARPARDDGDAALATAARQLLGLEVPASGAPREGEPFVEPTTGIALAWIPGRTFVMGSQPREPGSHADEKPARRVQLTGHWIGVYPVTNAQYQQFLVENARPAPRSFADRRFNDPAQPVVTVSWDDARAFAAWLTTKLPGGLVARLPTEAEWEHAARGTAGRRYPWGDDEPDETRATYGQPYDRGKPALVGRTPAGATPEGVHDLAGNVWEWCLDAWAASYAGRPDGERDPCHHGDTRHDDDTRGGPRAVRGGSWVSEPGSLRSAYRLWYPPHYQLEFLGFRVVCGGSPQPDPD